MADVRLERPLKAPLIVSSSHRAPQVSQTQESSRNDARYSRATS